ncbi:hypothetical protein PTKU46_41860 [Paraburkholderia terrae]|uniref:hypothetical protein n=1 Tax=Paraburkholderia terrae TaxID=311230 RepID=UPI0030E165E7
MAVYDESSIGDAPDLSLVRDDVGFRIQRRLGLIPAEGMGTVRRAIIFAAISWLPLAIWAIVTGRASWQASGDDALLAHFGIHVRCLVAIPLLVIAEGVAQTSIPAFLRYFVEAGLVPADKLPSFRALIASVMRLRNRTLPWILIFGAVVAWATAGAVFSQFEDMSWSGASGSANAEMTFGAWWFVLVIRPLFTALLLAWLWRACLVFVLLLKIAKFPLSLVPTHPDRVAGLGFVERLTYIFSPVAFAVSAVAATSFAHEVVYHGVSAMDIKGVLIATALLVSVVFLAPFAPLVLTLQKVKRQAILDYGSVVGRHGRLVHRRWILGEEIGSPGILDAPELGPVADVQTMFDAVKHMRTFPVSKVGLIAVAAPAVVPLLLVCALQMPIQGILLKVLKTLV